MGFRFLSPAADTAAPALMAPNLLAAILQMLQTAPTSESPMVNLPEAPRTAAGPEHEPAITNLPSPSVPLPHPRELFKPVPLPADWATYMGGAPVTAANKHGIDPRLVASIINAESAFTKNPTLRSHAGAIGPMQLMPGTAKTLNVDPTNPSENIDGGTRFIGQLLKRYYGDLEKALMAYNWGPTNVDNWLAGKTKRVPQETVDYVRKVLGAYYGE